MDWYTQAISSDKRSASGRQIDLLLGKEKGADCAQHPSAPLKLLSHSGESIDHCSNWFMAGTTGLEPATSAVTGQRSDQLSYVPRLFFNNLDICHIESSVSQLSLFSLFSTISLLWTQFRASVDTNGHQGGHQNHHRNDKIKSIRRDGFGVHVSRSPSKSFVPRSTPRFMQAS